MILQRLAELYDQMINDTPDLPLLGSSAEKVTHEIVINTDGQIVAIHDLRQDGKPVAMIVPVHKGRSSGIKPYILCDTSKYVFGSAIKKEKNTEKNIENFTSHLQAMFDLHNDLLSKCNDDGLAAFVKMLDNAMGNKITPDEELLNGTNLVFRLDGSPDYIHQSEAIRNISDDSDCGVKESCLVTGEVTEIARIHKGIKGIHKASKAGAALVGVNMKCAESNGKEQAYNSPTSTKIVDKYTIMLNYLTSNRKYTQYCGDDTYVFWTRNEAGQDFIFNQLMGGIVDDSEATNDNVKQMFEGLLNKGISTDLKTDNVCLLVLSGNNGRVAVKGWHDGALQDIVAAVKQHQDDLSIIGLDRLLTPYDLLRASSRDGKIDKIPSSVHLGLRQSILNKDKQYPRQLYVDILNRLRKETDAGIYITNIRYAFIKAYLQRLDNRKVDRYMLDTTNTNIGYNLGRLFAIFEKIQFMANNKVTIKDRYFSGASTTPLAVYPYLLRLSSNHITTLSSRGSYTGEDLILKVMEHIESIPSRLNLNDQGEFMLGYNHQKQYDKLQAINNKKSNDNTEVK